MGGTETKILFTNQEPGGGVKSPTSAGPSRLNNLSQPSCRTAWVLARSRDSLLSSTHGLI